MKHCPHCGIAHKEEATYCSICGKSFDIVEEQKNKQKQRDKQMDIGGAIIAAGFAFLFICFVGIISSLYVHQSINILGTLIWGVPGIILVAIGFIVFGKAFSKTK